MQNMIGIIILLFIAVICFLVSYFQFNERGFLFNNAYLYATKRERENMDKRPHYIQSGMVFLLVGIIFLLNVAELVWETGWLFYVIMAVVLITVVYAIVSSVILEKRKK